MLPSGVLGVDLGTSHTVAVLRDADGSAAPLLFDGSPLLPSAVYAESGDTLLVGRDAIHSARLRPERFEPNPKRRVDDGTVLLGDNEFDVASMFAAILSRVRTEAERVAGGLPPRTVITHPAVWGPARRLVLTDACQKARLGKVLLVPEPVAAARYFAGLPRVDMVAGKVVVVYDFGGGTFDVSVVGATASGLEVLAVDGSDSLGGVDIDHAIVEHIGQRFNGDDGWAELMGSTNTAGRRHRRTFLDDVRGAKERLSRQTRVELLIPVLDVDTHLTREELEAVTGPLLDKAVRLTEAVIRASSVSKDQVAGVFLVGGSSRMPLAATTLHQRTEIAPTVLDQPELVVATGATMSMPTPTSGVTPLSPVPVVAPVSPTTAPPVESSPPYVSPYSPPPVSSPPTGATQRRPGRSALKVLHWVQLSLLAAMPVVAIVMLSMYPNADEVIWTLVPLLAGILPAGSAVFTAINARRISSDPRRAHGGIKLNQSLTVGYVTVLAVVTEATQTPEPVIRFLCAAMVILAALILGLTRLSRPPGLIPQWQGAKRLRITFAFQIGLLIVSVAVMLAWWISLWAFDLHRGRSVILGDTVAATSTFAAVGMLILSGIGLVKAEHFGSLLRRGLLAAQSVWLMVVALYTIPWLYTVHHRLMPIASDYDLLTGRFAPTSWPWSQDSSADVFNVIGLWCLVVSAVPAILSIVQLSTVPRYEPRRPLRTVSPFDSSSGHRHRHHRGAFGRHVSPVRACRLFVGCARSGGKERQRLTTTRRITSRNHAGSVMNVTNRAYSLAVRRFAVTGCPSRYSAPPHRLESGHRPYGSSRSVRCRARNAAGGLGRLRSLVPLRAQPSSGAACVRGSGVGWAMDSCRAPCMADGHGEPGVCAIARHASRLPARRWRPFRRLRAEWGEGAPATDHHPPHYEPRVPTSAMNVTNHALPDTSLGCCHRLPEPLPCPAARTRVWSPPVRFILVRTVRGS